MIVQWEPLFNSQLIEAEIFWAARKKAACARYQRPKGVLALGGRLAIYSQTV